MNNRTKVRGFKPIFETNKMEFTKCDEWGSYSYFKPNEEIDFNILKTLDYRPHYIQKIDTIEVKIETPKDNAKLTAHQIETLNYIKENQSEIVTALYDYYSKMIFPEMNKAVNLGDIAKKNIAYNKNALNKVLGFIGLDIPFSKDSDAFYFFLHFEFSYDSDHGLYVLFRNNSAISSGNWSAKNYDLIRIYQNEWELDNETPLEICIYSPENNINHLCLHRFDEIIDLELKKGLYGVHIPWDVPQHFFSFYLENDVQKISLKELLTMKR